MPCLVVTFPDCATIVRCGCKTCKNMRALSTRDSSHSLHSKKSVMAA